MSTTNFKEEYNKEEEKKENPWDFLNRIHEQEPFIPNDPDMGLEDIDTIFKKMDEERKIKVTTKEDDVSNYSNVFSETYRNEILDLFNLENKHHYKPAMIALYYSIIGQSLIGNKIPLGTEKLDTRLSYIFSIRSGNGKRNLLDFVEEIVRRLGLNYSKITSLHEEQLVGKKIEQKIKGGNIRLVEKKGYFTYDIMVSDDALPLLAKYTFEIARNYIIQALDEHGKNEITKRSVNHNKEEAISYYPTVISYMFVQDKPVSQDHVDTGLIRKSPIIYINAPEVTEENYLNRALKQKPVNYDPLVRILKKAKNTTINWIFEEGTHQYLAGRTISILKKIRNNGEAGKSFCSMFVYTVQNYLYKYSAILAANFALRNEEENNILEILVTKEICELATKDFEIVIDAVFEYWRKFVKNSHHTKINLHQKAIIEELVKIKAISELAGVDKKPFINRMARQLDVSTSTIYYNIGYLETKELIKSKILGKAISGQSNSLIWLNE